MLLLRNVDAKVKDVITLVSVSQYTSLSLVLTLDHLLFHGKRFMNSKCGFLSKRD